jgi:uncharacterized protein (DUF1800 family)
MTAPQQRTRPNRLSRRSLLGGAAAAASLAAAYAALGDPAGILPSRPMQTEPPETAALDRESVRITHLLRRAGFGVTRQEFERYQALGLQKTTDELIQYGRVDDRAAVAVVNTIDANRSSPAVWWVVRMANTRRPLQEKMTLFWHGLLTTELTAVVDVPSVLAQNEFLRTNAMGDFRDILQGISLDRAMMVYLDTDGSERGSPNENYARELMELFSMGEGNYSEDDVREASRAFTGWTVPRPNPRNVFSLGEPEFHPALFDDGRKTFLGYSGNFKHTDIVDIILEQPATATYITRRLFEFFVYPGPDAATLAPFVDVYRHSLGNIGAVVAAILRSDVFYSARAYRAMVKTPVEFVVAAIKALGLVEQLPQLLPGRGLALRRMGQVLFDPPSVAGWPGGESWLSANMLLSRLNFLNDVIDLSAQNGSVPMLDLGTTRDALAHFLPLALDDNLPAAARRVLIEHAGGEDAPLTPEGLRGLAYLVLASPQFQLS